MNAKRIHSLRKLLWTLGIVNLIAMVSLIYIGGYSVSIAQADARMVNSTTPKTENEQRLVDSLYSMAGWHLESTMWISLLLAVQLVVFATIERKLANELRFVSKQDTTDLSGDE